MLSPVAAPGVTLIKEMSYDGAPEEWCNQYHMTLAPSDPAGWRTAIDGLIAEEKAVYTSRVVIKRALCYADTALPVTYDYVLADWAGDVNGTLSGGSSLGLPGDTAVWVRWDTGRRSSRGKPIYLRKYFHDARSDGSPTLDSVYSTQQSALGIFGSNLLSALGGGFALAGPDGVQPPGPSTNSIYATTRTLHRRGRRP